MNEYLISQLPLIVAIFAVLIIAPSEAAWRDLASLAFSVLGIAGTLVLMALLPVGGKFFGGAISVTLVGKTLAIVTLVLTGLALIMTEGYLKKIHVPIPEWRLTVLFISQGGATLCLADDLATLFVAFELLSIPSYALVGFSRGDGPSNEAGIKYLVLGILGSAFLLLGITFVYGGSGQIGLPGIREDLAAALVVSTRDSGVLAEMDFYRIALAAILIAFFFKTAVAPFHTWLLDVYQGASYAAISVIGVAAKVAVFAALYHVLHTAFEPLRDTWSSLLAIAAILSFVMGGLQGVRQTGVKRILACSAVLNSGFILLAMTGEASQFVFYLTAYAFATLGAIAWFVSFGTESADVDSIDDLGGIGQSQPVAAVGVTVLLMSSAGVPLTAGFVGKFGVLYSMFQIPESLPVIAAVVGVFASIPAFYFYFRLIRAIWFESGASINRQPRMNYRVVGIMLAVLLVAAGLVPGLLVWQ
ncbi:MAG: NADH-quinone oxidoreductase subunit N [Spirochaetia bacterium]|nr:NADH-quinone oxidoreductase subunit N [Spirochaetia bacterium]